LVEERPAQQGAAVDPTPFWWVELGYHSFAQGRDGFFPRTGEIVKHYRRLKMDTKGKPWTQRRLANALGVETDQTIWDLENKDTGMDFHRRQFLSKLLAIPPILLGIRTVNEIEQLVEQQRKASTVMVVVSTPIATSRKLTIDVEEYTDLLDNYLKTFINNPAQISITNIVLCIDGLDRELPRVRDKKPIQELLCRFHDLVACILGDQQEYDEALVHLEKALQFAQLLNDDELKVLVLHDYGIILWKAGRPGEALKRYQEARRYEQRLPDNLRGALLLETGSTKALVASTPDKKDAAIALIDQVGNIVRSNRKEADPYFLDLNLDRYHLTRSRSLIAVGRNRDAIEEIGLVKGGPEYPHRQAEKDIYQAQALTNLGKYPEATPLATSGLIVAQEIDSKVNIALVERMYKKFPRDLFKHDDDVARLEYLLRYK